MFRMRSGFTMLELIMVIVLLGILSAVAAPKWVNLFGAANDAKILSIYTGFIAGIDHAIIAGQLNRHQGGLDYNNDGILDLFLNGQGFPEGGWYEGEIYRMDQADPIKTGKACAGIFNAIFQGDYTVDRVIDPDNVYFENEDQIFAGSGNIGGIGLDHYDVGCSYFITAKLAEQEGDVLTFFYWVVNGQQHYILGKVLEYGKGEFTLIKNNADMEALEKSQGGK